VSNSLNVLLVDEDDYLIIRNLLSKIPGVPFKLEWTDSLKEARSIIEQSRHDIYLVDYRLGAEDGLELLGSFDLVQRPEPFIILTGAGDERVERRAMKLGVADYLVKGALDSELLSRVLHYSLQRKLVEAQRVHQLMEINRSKDEFIALASHQLRTPATAVKQYLGMVLEGYAGDVTPEQQKFLNSAYESNERQIQVVNDILRVAKLDLKKITLKRTSVDLGKLLESILHDMASQFSNRDQKLHFRPPGKPLLAEVDSEYIRMAIGNIIDNASKYTPPGKGVTVSVTAGSKNTIVTKIQDEGVGIDGQDIDKLFKKFSRIDNPLSVKVGGTGLGLYWSNEVVQLHGGSITVTSTPGVGTSFKISLSCKA
jgi:two-component system sensor histidine kinase/response regulator